MAVITDERLSHCGVNFCPQEWLNYTNKYSSEFKKDDSATANNINTLIGILFGCVLASAIVLAVFVDPPSKYSITMSN